MRHFLSRSVPMALALAVTLLVPACVIAYEPVNLNLIDTRSPWDDNFRGGRTVEPAGR